MTREEAEALMDGETGFVPRHIQAALPKKQSINHEKMGDIVAGKEAGYLMGQLDPFFRQIKENQIENMKTAFRDGLKDEVSLRVAVGVLCSIDDLQNMILKYARKGQEAERNI